MKKLLALMLILLLGLFAGCITDSDDDDDDNNDNGGTSGGGTAAEYFPLSSGGSWTFENTDTWSDGSTYTETNTVSTSGTTTLDGKTYIILSDTSEEDDMYFRIENNVIYMYDESDMEMASMKNAAKMAVMASIAAEDVPWMKFGVSKGNTWTINEHSGQYEGYSFSMSHKGKYIGTESVTVPAGSYSNCMKFQMTYEYSFSSGGETGSYVDTETFWFAKGVGPVKIVTTEQELGVVNLTSVSVLKSFVKGNSGS